MINIANDDLNIKMHLPLKKEADLALDGELILCRSLILIRLFHDCDCGFGKNTKELLLDIILNLPCLIMFHID